MNDKLVEELKAKYADFYNLNVPYAKEYMLGIGQYGNDHTALMLKLYGNGIMQFEAGFALISHILEKINYIDKDNWPKHRATQYIFLIHNMKGLYAAFDLLTKGFSEGALALLRPVYEATINVVYISLHIETQYKTISRNGISIDSVIHDELKLTHWDDYMIMSQFAHANRFEVAKEIRDVGNGRPVTIHYRFDKKYTELAMNYMQFIFLFVSKFMNKYLVTSTNDKLMDEDRDNLIKFIELQESAREIHPTPRWKDTTRDLEFIFELMDVSESGRNLKQYRKNKIKSTKQNFVRVLRAISEKVK